MCTTDSKMVNIATSSVVFGKSDATTIKGVLYRSYVHHARVDVNMCVSNEVLYFQLVYKFKVQTILLPHDP